MVCGLFLVDFRYGKQLQILYAKGFLPYNDNMALKLLNRERILIYVSSMHERKHSGVSTTVFDVFEF